MNYASIVLRDALKELEQDALNTQIRTNFSCTEEIHKINVIKKQLERQIFISENISRVNLRLCDYEDIKKLIESKHTLLDVSKIYCCGISTINNLIEKHK